MSVTAHARNLLDPRGRANRAGLLRIALLLLAADALAVAAVLCNLVDPVGPAIVAFKGVSLWIATAAVSKRLHDLGLCTCYLARGLIATAVWSVVVALALMAVFTPMELTDTGHRAFWINVVVVSVPVLAAILWLHAKRGEAGANRFGPEPDASGFAYRRRSVARHEPELQAA